MDQALLQEIRKISAANLSGLEPPTTVATIDSRRAVEEVRAQLKNDVKDRIDEAIRKFAERLETLAASPAPPNRELAKTQEIRLRDLAQSAPVPGEIVTVLKNIESELGRLGAGLRDLGQSSPRAETLVVDLDGLEERFERLEDLSRDVNGQIADLAGRVSARSNTEGESASTLEEIRVELANLRRRETPSSTVILDEDRIARRLTDMIEGISAGSSGAAGSKEIVARIERLEQRLDDRLTKTGEALDQLRRRPPELLTLEGTLGQRILQRLAELQKHLTSTLDAMSDSMRHLLLKEADRSEDMKHFQERLQRELQELQFDSRPSPPSEAEIEWRERVVDELARLRAIPEKISGLDDSVGAKVERTQERLVEAVRECQKALALERSQPDPGARRAVQELKEDVAELKALPEKLSAILNASVEVQQFGLESRIDEAVERIIAQIEARS